MNVRHDLNRCKTVRTGHGAATSFEELRHMAEHAASLKDIVNFHPTKGIGLVREITNAVLSLSSSQTPFVTGAPPIRSRWLGRDLRLDSVMITSIRVRVLLLHAPTRRGARTAAA